MAVRRLVLEGRSGNGAVPTGVYTLLVPVNPKRNWFTVQVPKTEADTMLLVLSRQSPDVPGAEFTNILVEPGTSVVLSMDGDMPWQGAIWATGLVADSSCYWSEAEDYP